MMMTTAATSWIEQVRAEGCARVGVALGLEYIESPRPGSLAPCPSCGATTRSERSGGGDRRRGPVGLRSDGLGWNCFRCEAKGDAVTLAAWRVGGGPRCSGREVWEACAGAGLCDAPAGRKKSQSQSQGAAQHHATSTSPLRPLPPRPDAGGASAAAPPPRPPLDEVEALRRACRPVTEDSEVSAWLTDRGFDPEEIARHKLAGALPMGSKVPRWARFNRSPWNAEPRGWRAVVPMYDADGRLVSVHARALDRSIQPKGLSPAGYAVRGLVLANDLGRRLLQGDSTAAERGLVVPEGCPDFWAWSTNGEGLAALGVIAGSWPEDAAELAAKVPDGTRVVIATHHDPAGDKYAQKIFKTLAPRVRAGRLEVARWAPEEGEKKGGDHP